MDDASLRAVARLLALELLAKEEMIVGYTLIQGLGVPSRAEFIEIGRRALKLIEEGKVR